MGSRWYCAKVGSVLTNHRRLYRGTLNDLRLITWDPTERPLGLGGGLDKPKGFAPQGRAANGVAASQPVATRPLAIQQSGTWYVYGTDLPKNVTELYSTSGYIHTAYTYSPYGLVTSSGNVTQPLQWSSEYADTDLGLVYYNYRHYNPLNGRWTGRDPLSFKVRDNLYLYVKGSPIAFTDCLGERVTFEVSEATCEITIKFNIVIYPDPETPISNEKMKTVAENIKGSIEQHWSGHKKGCCDVNAKVTATIQESRSNRFAAWLHDENNIAIRNQKHRSYVRGGNSGVWEADADSWVYAHEAGHLAGLPDNYSDDGKGVSHAHPGHEGHMMAEFGGQVDQHEIDALLEKQSCPCDKKPN